MSSEKIFLLIGGGESDFATIRQVMELDGYTVTHAAEGEAGFQAAVELAPDVIATDCLALCLQLRQSPGSSETPIVWLAETAEEDKAEAALRAGADELLRKPVSGLETRARIRALVRSRQLRERVREIQQLRQDFMDQLVHDIRSPLQVILGFSELLDESIDIPATERNQVRSIRGAASRLENLADNLIVSTRLETGDLVPLRQLLAPFELADRIVRAARPIAELKRITISLDVPKEFGALNADSNLIGRVLQIFLDNAIRISPSGSALQVRVRTGDRAGFINFEVIDRGPEISEDEREPIFDLPRLLEMRRAGHAPHGRGLGLSLCRLVAEAHGGRARVESNPAGGSIFILELPLASS